MAVPVIGLVAAHIKDTSDLDLLKSMVFSATISSFDLATCSRTQLSISVNCLYISISADDAIVPNLKEFQATCEDAGVCKFLLQREKQQQFQHYSKLKNYLQSIELDPRTLIIFGDADDEWFAHRAECMSKVSSHFGKDVSVFNWKTILEGEHRVPWMKPQRNAWMILNTGCAAFAFHTFVIFLTKLVWYQYIASRLGVTLPLTSI